MNFNEVMDKMSDIQDKFGDFKVIYLNINAEKGDEKLNLCDNSVGMKEGNGEIPFTNICVEHEISHKKVEDINTIGDLKILLENIDDNFEIADICLFCTSREKEFKGIAITKRLFTYKDENTFSEEYRYEV